MDLVKRIAYQLARWDATRGGFNPVVHADLRWELYVSDAKLLIALIRDLPCDTIQIPTAVDSAATPRQIWGAILNHQLEKYE